MRKKPPFKIYHKSQPDKKGLIRIGTSERLIAKVVKNYNLIGITSIFTPQTFEALLRKYLWKTINNQEYVRGKITRQAVPEI